MESQDLAGNNTIDDGTNTYTWDAMGRLKTVDTGSDLVTFTYNAAGQRVSKESNAGTTYYLYDFKNLLQEVDEEGNLLVAYTGSNDEYGDLISEYHTDIDSSSSSSGGALGPGEYYHQYEAQLNTQTMVDEFGDVAQQYQYQAFGLMTKSTNGEPMSNLQFVGQQMVYRLQKTRSHPPISSSPPNFS